MAAYVAGISVLFGKKSGALVNPAVTITMFRTGNMSAKDAFWYIVAQFTGAVAGAMLIKLFLYDWFSHPNIHFGITKPLPPHESQHAFIAEFIISFITMWTILYFSSKQKLEKYLPLMMGIWIGVFLIFELPYSGMSMNPARSFAGSFAANQWGHLWIYFAAPILAMLLAAELFFIWRKRVRKAELMGQKEELQRLKDYPAS